LTTLFDDLNDVVVEFRVCNTHKADAVLNKTNCTMINVVDMLNQFEPFFSVILGVVLGWLAMP
jgi:hypothetical protein